MTTYRTLVPMTWKAGIVFPAGTEVAVTCQAEQDLPGRLHPVEDPSCEMTYWPREIEESK